MKIILVASVAVNGQVLLAEKSHHEAPQEVFGAFFQKAIETGNMILGKNTYRVLLQFPGVKEVLSSLEIVVLSRTKDETGEYTTAESPEQAIEYLKRKGFNTLLVGGGVQVYNVFLKKDLITDLYFSIVPIVTGDGGLLEIADGEVIKFKLESQKMITPDVIQIHFTKS